MDPSLCERQRQLKRAKLADSLANQLSHRPGPLELIQKNILHTDDPVEQAVKEGTLQFKPTAEGVVSHWRQAGDDGVLVPDEDSNDTTAGSPSQGLGGGETPLPGDQPQAVSVPALLQKLQQGEADRAAGATPVPLSPRSSRSESLGDIAAVARPAQVAPGAPGPPPDINQLPRSVSFGGSWGNLTSLLAGQALTNGEFTSKTQGLASGPSLQREAPGKDMGSRKKLKSKSKPVTAPKPRTIKFHEYKV